MWPRTALEVIKFFIDMNPQVVTMLEFSDDLNYLYTKCLRNSGYQIVAFEDDNNADDQEAFDLRRVKGLLHAACQYLNNHPPI